MCESRVTRVARGSKYSGRCRGYRRDGFFPRKLSFLSLSSSIFLSRVTRHAIPNYTLLANAGGPLCERSGCLHVDPLTWTRGVSASNRERSPLGQLMPFQPDRARALHRHRRPALPSFSSSSYDRAKRCPCFAPRHELTPKYSVIFRGCPRDRPDHCYQYPALTGIRFPTIVILARGETLNVRFVELCGLECGGTALGDRVVSVLIIVMIRRKQQNGSSSIGLES